MAITNDAIPKPECFVSGYSSGSRSSRCSMERILCSERANAFTKLVLSITRFLRRHIIASTVEAVYEDGVLKPAQSLPLREHEKVQLTVKRVVSRVRQTAGLIGWTGSQEEADVVALSPDLDPGA